MADFSGTRKLSWADAAQRAGYGFTSRATALGLPGLLFRAGEKTQMTGVVDALGAANPFVAGTITGHYAGETAIPRVLSSSFVAIPLSRRVPNAALLARGLGMLEHAGVELSDRQRLSLEGNFDRIFTLYCPRGYERDALEIFAPNLLEQLLATTGGCDVELVDDWMFVYSAPGRYRSASALAAVENATVLVQSTVQRQSVRYADDRVETGPTGTVSPARFAAGLTPLQQVIGALTAGLLVVAAVVYIATLIR